jgi:hypothetical protein
MKKINKTVEYNKLTKIGLSNGLDMYEASAAAMEMVLTYDRTKGASLKSPKLKAKLLGVLH